MTCHGPPEHIRSDNGPEFVAKHVRSWLGRIGVKTLYIEPGGPWENGYCESFNSKLRDELLEGEQFSTLYEAQVLIERWRRHYNAVRPHSSLGYRPPAPETILPPAPALAYAALRPAQTLADDGRVLMPLFPGLEPDRPKQSDVVLEGRRNDTAFSEGLVLAGRSGSLEELQEGLERWNRDHAKPPLEAAEVAGIARSAWNYQTEGRNFATRPSVIISHGALAVIGQHRNGANALLLYSHLLRQHSKRRVPFAIATAAMAKAEIFAGWTEWRFRKAKEALLVMGFVQLHRKGRRFGRRNEPDQFVFGDRM